MHNSRMKQLRNLTTAGVFAALIFVTTAYLLHIPTGFNGGYIHLGDTFIYIAACLLPTPYAMAAGSIGAALSDVLTGGIIWAPFTLVIKALLTLYFSYTSNKFITKRNAVAVLLAGLTGLAGYYLAGVVISRNFIAPFVTLPVDAIQPIASGILFIVIGVTLDRLDFKKTLLRRFNVS